MFKLYDKVYILSDNKIKEWEIYEINIRKYIYFNGITEVEKEEILYNVRDDVFFMGSKKINFIKSLFESDIFMSKEDLINNLLEDENNPINGGN